MALTKITGAGTGSLDSLTTTGALDVTTSTHANASVFKSTGNTQIMLQDTDASANDQFWGFQVSGGDFNVLTCNDDRASGFVTPLTIAQAGDATFSESVIVTGTANRGLKITSAQTSTGQNDADAVYDAQDTEGGGTGSHIFKVGGSEKVRIDGSGNFLVGKTDTGTDDEGAVLSAGGLQSFTRDGQKVLRIRRNTSDGTIVEFFQAGNQEGTISVSGSTVSYNGGHLSRWSQATDGKRIDGLVKGTVMTNLDQMAVWTHDEVLWKEGDNLPDGVSVGDVRTAAYTEDNEQLNCMAVSSVEGDANVAGVFVNWDDDDEDYTADMNVAMTGDMVIRIAKDTTVARGDLLMSAGDGTAKPQDDDIVRSKTIAKVTSTTKSHTYDDGSYLVPCVLMAC